jgi:hypothetical protein
VAATLSRLAKVQRVLGNNQAALQAIEESLRIKQHNLGPQHPDVAADLMTMAEVLSALVRSTQAEYTFAPELPSPLLLSSHHCLTRLYHPPPIAETIRAGHACIRKDLGHPQSARRQHGEQRNASGIALLASPAHVRILKTFDDHRPSNHQVLYPLIDLYHKFGRPIPPQWP